VHQARRSVPDEGARARPDLWPSPDVVITNLAACLGSALQLEGEQNFHIPCAGSELHAACPTSPSIFVIFTLTLSVTVRHPARENAPGEGAASEWRATDICPERWEPPDLPCGEGAAIERRTTEARRPEPWKPPDPHDEVLQESGGALSALGNVPVIQDHLGPAAMAENADVRLPEPSSVDAHERGRALPVVGAAPALAKDTAGVEPAGEATRAAAAKSEALVPQAQGEAKREIETSSEGEGQRKPEAPPRKGKHEVNPLPQKLEREGEHEPGWPSREPSHDVVLSLSISEGPGPWDPGGPVGEQTIK
jgi:hypothetical protein